MIGRTNTGGGDTITLKNKINDLNSQLTTANNTISGLNTQVSNLKTEVNNLKSGVLSSIAIIGYYRLQNGAETVYDHGWGVIDTSIELPSINYGGKFTYARVTYIDYYENPGYGSTRVGIGSSLDQVYSPPKILYSHQEGSAAGNYSVYIADLSTICIFLWSQGQVPSSSPYLRATIEFYN